jgi:Arc/MetJ family transcription regulator
MVVGMYDAAMPRRTTIEVDEQLLGRAQAALGTQGLKDTVDAALIEAIRRAQRQRLAERIAAGTGIDRSVDLLHETRPTR